MYFDSLQSLLHMDGHGVYVWVAYLVTFLVIIAVLSVPIRRRRRLLSQLSAEGRRVRGASTGREGE